MTEEEMYERIHKDVEKQYKEELGELCRKVAELERKVARLREQVEQTPMPPAILETMTNMYRDLLEGEGEFYDTEGDV